MTPDLFTHAAAHTAPDPDNAHFDAAAMMADSDLGPPATATLATLEGRDPENATAQASDGPSGSATVAGADATVAAKAWAAPLHAALKNADHRKVIQLRPKLAQTAAAFQTLTARNGPGPAPQRHIAGSRHCGAAR